MIRRRRSCLASWAAMVLLSLTVHAKDESARAGDETTVFDEGPTAYGRALANLRPQHWSPLLAGKARFVRPWPERTLPADAAACSDCHFRDGRGPRPDRPHAGLTHLLRLGLPSGAGDPNYGVQLRRLGNGSPPPAAFAIEWEESAGHYRSGETYTLRRPRVVLGRLANGPLDRATRLSLRVPPAVFGLGLLEAIPEREILARADPHDANGDGISGRPQYVPGPSAKKRVLGRFGWKAAQPSLYDQSATALCNDLGATRATRAELKSLADYLRALAVPARRLSGNPVVRQGERLFASIGCGGCHLPRTTTGALPSWPELSRQVIRPYTDLLLHDMGEDLNDGLPEGIAEGREWRTPPLWGLGLLPVISGEMRLLHDGRARSIEETILWHGGEAERSRREFIELPKVRREALTAFVESL